MSTENIDWSKAPEGFQVWVQDMRPELGADLSGWHKELSDRYLDQEGSHWPKENEGKWFTVYRPSESWSGEGLPPIGTTCEMLSHGEEESEWIEVQILAYTKINGEDHAVFQYEEHVGTGSLQGSCFRPVRTAQERGLDLVLSEIEALYAEGGPAAIYDAGYRKVDQPGAQP